MNQIHAWCCWSCVHMLTFLDSEGSNGLYNYAKMKVNEDAYVKNKPIDMN